MPDQDEIDNQQELLAAHRRTLHIFLKQLADLGHHHAPPGIFAGIREQRREIERIKTFLRESGVTVQDLPGDQEISTDSPVHITGEHPLDQTPQIQPKRALTWISFRTPSCSIYIAVGAVLLTIIGILWWMSAATPRTPLTPTEATQPTLVSQNTSLPRITTPPIENPTPPQPQSTKFALQCSGSLIDHETRSIAFSPDQKQLATAGNNQTIYLWDTASCKVQSTLEGNTAIITSLSWSSNGQWLASGSDDGIVRIWDVPMKRQIASYNQEDNQHVPVLSVAWAPDGKRLASTGMDGWVIVVTIDNDTVVDRIPINLKDKGKSVAWQIGHPSRLVVSGVGKFWVVDLDTRFPTRTSLKDDADDTTDIAWSPNGQCLAIAGEHQRIYIVPSEQWDSQPVLEGASGVVTGVTWLYDGRWLASAVGGQPILFWDVPGRTSFSLEPINSDKDDRPLRIVSKGNLLATASDTKLSIWSIPADQPDVTTPVPGSEEIKGCVGPVP
jgi:WD40 repeat protein